MYDTKFLSRKNFSQKFSLKFFGEEPGLYQIFENKNAIFIKIEWLVKWTLLIENLQIIN